jgi:predicted nucleic acid-binding protein
VAVVVDANMLVVMVSGDVRQLMASEQIEAWITAGEEIHAPELLPYEVASAFTRLVAGRSISSRQARLAWEALELLPVVQHPLADDLPRVVDIALALKRRSAYDAAYIALAQELGAVLWTLDGPLARNAQSAGFPVRLLDETKR